MPSRSRSAARRSRSTSFVRPPFPPRSFSPSSPLISPTPVALSLSARVVSRKWLECFAVAGQRATYNPPGRRRDRPHAPLVSRWMERLLAGNRPPVTVGEYLALEAIAEGDIVGAALARRAAVSPAAVSQLLSALEDDGLIRRRRHAGDRRGNRSCRRDAGTTRGSRRARSLVDRVSELLDELPGRDADALGRLLAALERPLGGTPPRRPPRPRRPPPPKRA